MSAASLVTIATGLSAGTTLVTCTALAAVVTALALVSSSLLRAVTTTLLGFGATFVLATTFMLTTSRLTFGTTFVLTATMLHLAGSHLLAASAGTFLTGTTLGIGGTVACSIAATTVLAGAELLFRTLAVGLLAALGSVLATFVLATTTSFSATESVNILLDSAEHHFANTLGGQGCTSDTIHLSLGFAGTLLDHGEGDLSISHYRTTDELALELLFLDEGTKAGGLALMVKVCTKHFLEVTAT